MAIDLSIQRTLRRFSIASFVSANIVAAYGHFAGQEAEFSEVTQQYLIRGYAPLYAVAVAGMVAYGAFVKYRCMRRIADQRETETDRNPGRTLDAVLADGEQ
jgi:hypothetical protein